MKKIKFKIPELTNLVYLIIYLGVLVLPLSLVAICSYFIPALNHFAFKAYYTYYGGVSLSLASIFILILTHIYLKTNFKDNQKKIDKAYLIKINLIFIIFHIIFNIISSLLNYFNIDNYFIYALYLFYPLIYFCVILFSEPHKLSRKNVITIFLSIYLLWYAIVPFVSFLVGYGFKALVNPVTFKSLLYMLLYNYLHFSLLVMPFMGLALNKVANEHKKKSLVHKFDFSIKKLAIIAIVLVVLGTSVLVLISR